MLFVALLLTAVQHVPPAGTYTYTYVADSSDDIRMAVDHTIRQMNFFVRPIARGRLNHVNPIPQKIHFTIDGKALAVSFDDGNPVVTPMTGHEVPWRSSITHEDYQVHVVQNGDTLSQVIVAPDGTRQNVYVFDPDAHRLELRVTITSRRLPEPLHYTLLFHRDAA